MAKYDIYKGMFPCHTCKETVFSMRWYYETKEMSWMCKQGHISEVDFSKKKKDKNDREIGE